MKAVGLFGTKASSLLAQLALLASLAPACRVNPANPELENTPEGKACPPDAMIEDAEDNNNQALVQDGRNGYVYTFADPSGSSIEPVGGGQFSMTPGGANGSQYAMRMTGQLASAQTVYAAMGINMTDPKATYDASKYQGISLFAKKGPGSTSKLRVKVSDQNTDPDGGVCAVCSNDFGIQLTLSEDWQKFIIPFGALRQEASWGNPRPRSLNADAIFAIQFAVNDKGKPFDVWVDDVAFTGCP